MESREPPAAPPTVEDVEAYCKANGLHIDAGHFVRHFEAGGWFDSKGRKVANWRQKALEWEKYEAQGRRGNKKATVHRGEFEEAERWQEGHRPWNEAAQPSDYAEADRK